MEHGYAVNTPIPQDRKGCSGGGCFRFFLGFLSLVALVGGLFLISLGKIISLDNIKLVANEIAEVSDLNEELGNIDSYADDELLVEYWETVMAMDEINPEDLPDVLNEIKNYEGYKRLTDIMPDLDIDSLRNLSPSNAMTEIIDTTIEGFYEMRTMEIVRLLPRNLQDDFTRNLPRIVHRNIDYVSIDMIQRDTIKTGWIIAGIGLFLLILMIIMGKRGRRITGPGFVLLLAGLSGLNLLLPQFIATFVEDEVVVEKTMTVFKDIFSSIFKSHYVPYIIIGGIMIIVGILISQNRRHSDPDFMDGPPPPDAVMRE